jgi:hypothetical protein
MLRMSHHSNMSFEYGETLEKVVCGLLASRNDIISDVMI